MPKVKRVYQFSHECQLSPGANFLKFEIEAESSQDFSIKFHGTLIDERAIPAADLAAIKAKVEEHFFLEFCADEDQKNRPENDEFGTGYVHFLNGGRQ